MILSRTSQYAIQALIYVAAQPRGVPVLKRMIAQYLNVPPAYLAKVLQTLERGALLHSFRGRQGGYCLREGCEKTDLMQILTLIEGPGLTGNCVLGLKVCSDETPCPMHVKWTPIKASIVELLQKQTLEVLALAVKSGKYRLTDLPGAILSAESLPAGRRRTFS
ncbi:MAG TPA: Rrf2 family transcriptional regulator [Rhodocyclaceae bacterium]|nr:Rrf2 family transcriptional regulator [Rhodocyclaceae bacterium]